MPRYKRPDCDSPGPGLKPGLYHKILIQRYRVKEDEELGVPVIFAHGDITLFGGNDDPLSCEAQKLIDSIDNELETALIEGVKRETKVRYKQMYTTPQSEINILTELKYHQEASCGNKDSSKNEGLLE